MPAISRSARSTNHRYSGAATSTDPAPPTSVGDPRIGVGEQLLDVRGQPARDHVGQRDLLKHGTEAGSHRDPDLLEVLGGAVVAGSLGPEPPHLGQWPVQGTDHVGDRHVVGVAGEPVPALGAPLAGDDPGAPEVGQDRAEEAGRQTLLPGQGLGRLRRPGGGQGEQRTDAVVHLGRDVHCESLPAPPPPGHVLGLRAPCKDLTMARIALHISGDAEADALVSRDPLALLIGMVLDQQVTIEKAFSSPAELARRLGGDGPLDAASIAAMEPDELAAVFKERPALHRYPGSMAGRIQNVCRAVVEEYGGQADAIWKGVRSGEELMGRLRALPGFGEQKARIFAALLGKQLGVRPEGWQEASSPYGDPGTHLSVADIVDAESLATVRATKKAAKARARAGA